MYYALQLGGQALRDASGVDASGRQLLQAADPAARAHRIRLHHVSPASAVRLNAVGCFRFRDELAYSMLTLAQIQSCQACPSIVSTVVSVFA